MTKKEGEFGKKQFSEIKRVCRKTVRNYKVKHPENQYNK